VRSFRNGSSAASPWAKAPRANVIISSAATGRAIANRIRIVRSSVSVERAARKKDLVYGPISTLINYRSLTAPHDLSLLRAFRAAGFSVVSQPGFSARHAENDRLTASAGTQHPANGLRPSWCGGVSACPSLASYAACATATAPRASNRRYPAEPMLLRAGQARRVRQSRRAH